MENWVEKKLPSEATAIFIIISAIRSTLFFIYLRCFIAKPISDDITK